MKDLSDLVRDALQRDPGLTQTEIARRVGLTPAAINSWVNRRRGTGRGPNRETLVKLAQVLGLPEREVFAAAGRKTPGPVAPDQEQRILEAFRELTAEQQQIIEIQMNALRDHNRANEPA